MEEAQIEALKEKFPFLTYGTYLNVDYIGIIQNSDNHIVSMYVYSNIDDKELKEKFLEYGDEWWWESNRQIPINIFLKKTFTQYRPYLKTFIRKDFNTVFGPMVSLQEIINKRIKRRTITLVKKSGL